MADVLGIGLRVLVLSGRYKHRIGTIYGWTRDHQNRMGYTLQIDGEYVPLKFLAGSIRPLKIGCRNKPLDLKPGEED